MKSSNMGGPIINGLSSLSLRAGVGDVLIISGENFGTVKGKVLFRDADNPEDEAGAPIYLDGLDDIYYVPQPGNPDGWKDDQIAVKIPSRVYDGESDGHGAGSGFVIVQLPGVGGLSTKSDDILVIEYSLNNYGNLVPGAPANLPIQQVYMARSHCLNGFVFSLHSSFLPNGFPTLLSMQESQIEGSHIGVYDMIGSLQHQHSVSDTTLRQTTIDISTLPAGTYWVVWFADGEVIDTQQVKKTN